MRVAMLGSRGVPARYGGIERHVEEVGAGLAARGHDVTVFGVRAGGDEPHVYRGMTTRRSPAIHTKHFESITQTAAATVTALRGFDVLHFHALGPGMLTPVPRALRVGAVVQTVHGLDNEREKWGTIARRVLLAAQWMSAYVPHATMVVSDSLARHYRRVYGIDVVVVGNGVSAMPPRSPSAVAERWGLRSGEYALFVGRLVPEKAPDLLIRAFAEVDTDLDLVIVGAPSYTGEYAASLERLAAHDPRVRLLGPVYGEDVAHLFANAALFVSPSNLEAGVPITVLEAAAAGVPVLLSDIGPQREFVPEDAPARRLFRARDVQSCRDALARIVVAVDAERRAAEGLKEAVVSTHGWGAVADATEAVYRTVAR